MKFKFANSNMSKIVYTICIFIILAIFVFTSSKIKGFLLYPDEFGYWSTAAWINGYDWSKMASISSYYSYGYGLLLTPIMCLTGGGEIGYKIAILLNFILSLIGLILLCGIVGRLYRNINDVTRILISLISICYPAWMFYNQTTMAEGLLFFLVILISYILLRILTEEANILWYLAFGVTTGYILMVHMRTIGIVIAVVITMVVHIIDRIVKHRAILANGAIFFATLFIMLILHVYIKGYITSTVYAYEEQSRLAINNMSGQAGKFSDLLSLDGMVKLVVSVAGKIMYMITASFGMFVWCVYGVVKRFRERKVSLFHIYILLSMLGMLGITSIYLLNVGISDVAYGRYEEIVIPLFIALGCAELITSAKQTSKIMLMITIFAQVVLLVVIIVRFIGKDLGQIRGWHAVAMSYLTRTSLSSPVQIALCTVLGLFACIVITLINRTNYKLVFILMVEVVSIATVTNIYTFFYANQNIQNLVTANTLTRRNVTNITYLYTGLYDERGGTLQFYLPEAQIDTCLVDNTKGNEIANRNKIEELSYTQDAIYTDMDMELAVFTREVLMDKYPYFRRAGDFEVYYR